MAAPALIYVLCNWGNAQALRGWTIPTATDIAFALGVLLCWGHGFRPSLKLFLLAVAIIDDLGAIIIIAAFYTAELSRTALALAGVGVALLVALNLAGVARRAPYMLAGVFLWVCVLKSGVHATIAGVVVGPGDTVAHWRRGFAARQSEHDLHPWVAFGVLPLFAFANAGLRLTDVTPGYCSIRLQLGIALGLFLGKQLGIAGSIWAATRIGWQRLPEGATWRQVYGLSLLTGIGFTMSLFIGGLAFPAKAYNIDVRVAVLFASSASAICGYLVLRTRRSADAVQLNSTVTTS